VIGEGAIFFNGCNVNIGTYTLDGENVQHGEGWASTGNTCDVNHDQEIIDLIQSTTTQVFDQDSGTLTFSDAAGTLLKFKIVS
jgi:heat shock protein HslJ